MARLIHIDASMVQRHRGEPIPIAAMTSAWRATRPWAPMGIQPWFELTPRAPAVDTRVSPGVGLGVAADMQTFGGITGPAVGDGGTGRDPGDPALVVLGGNAVPPETPEPTTVETFERQCTLRVSIACDGLDPGRQCLLVTAVRASGPDERCMVQVFLGTTLLATPVLTGEDRIAVLADAPKDGRLACALWFRLCGRDRRVRLGVHGVAGHLL